jgi:glycerophosphoryl diester phosphodiesterase
MQLWPENSPLSLREAVRLGAQMIEFDLRLSKDGEPMVIHDQTVDRMTNGTGRISEMTARELKQLTYRSDGEPLPDSERILTLREALELFPRNIWLNLHLKGKVERTGWQIRLTRFLRSTRKKTALARIVTRQIIDCGRRH